MSNQTTATMTDETKAIVSSNPQVFTTAVPKKPSDDEYGSDRYVQAKKNKRPQIVGDYMALLARIANNDTLHVPVRVSKLNELTKKFRTGFPRKNNQEFVNKWSTVLANASDALANQLIQIEKCKTGHKDLGQLGGPDQKKLSAATMQDLATTVEPKA